MPVTEEAIELDEEWRTDDMSLAAYLRYLNPEDFLRYEWEGASCYIVFERSEEIVQQATSFMGGDARVDPVRYLSVRAQVREELKSSRPSTDGQHPRRAFND